MASQSPQPKPSLLQRLRQRLARILGGDVIITTIGPGASDNVVGKNIIKIGTLVVPALSAVVALLVALMSGVIGLWLYLVPAKMPAGYFNVAVGEFSQVEGQGRERVTADSALISRTLFATIQGELEQLPPDYQAVQPTEPPTLEPPTTAPEPPTATLEPPTPTLEPIVSNTIPGNGEYDDGNPYNTTANDPGVGPNDGDGIESVTFQFSGPDGQEVYNHIEKPPRYCAFGGGDNGQDCNVWRFSEHNNQWPSGTAVESGGAYSLQVTVDANSGQQASEGLSFTIQL